MTRSPGAQRPQPAGLPALPARPAVESVPGPPPPRLPRVSGGRQGVPALAPEGARPAPHPQFPAQPARRSPPRPFRSPKCPHKGPQETHPPAPSGFFRDEAAPGPSSWGLSPRPSSRARRAPLGPRSAARGPRSPGLGGSGAPPPPRPGPGVRRCHLRACGSLRSWNQQLHPRLLPGLQGQPRPLDSPRFPRPAPLRERVSVCVREQGKEVFSYFSF